MVQSIPRSKARLTQRRQFRLGHLRVCREQGHTLRGYAKAHGLSVSGLYTAHSTLKSRGVVTEPAPSAPTFVPVRITPGGAAFRMHLPNGVVVEVPRTLRARPVPRCSTVRAGCHDSSANTRFLVLSNVGWPCRALDFVD